MTADEADLALPLGVAFGGGRQIGHDAAFGAPGIGNQRARTTRGGDLPHAGSYLLDRSTDDNQLSLGDTSGQIRGPTGNCPNLFGGLQAFSPVPNADNFPRRPRRNMLADQSADQADAHNCNLIPRFHAVSARGFAHRQLENGALQQTTAACGGPRRGKFQAGPQRETGCAGSVWLDCAKRIAKHCNPLFD